MTDIAFLGLGNMGGPMAANLLKAGHRVNVFDLQPKAVLSLVEQGAQAPIAPCSAAKAPKW